MCERVKKVNDVGDETMWDGGRGWRRQMSENKDRERGKKKEQWMAGNNLWEREGK